MAPFGTASVAIATTPTVVSTFFSHLLAKPSRRSEAKKSLASGGPGGGPENDLSYEEGLKLVRRFLDFSSHRGVEEVQAFTAMQVPTPHWVKREVVSIPEETIASAAAILGKHLKSYKGGKGLEVVGGERWWQVRGKELEGEWIEKDYLRRKARRTNSSSTTLTSPTDGEGPGPPNTASVSAPGTSTASTKSTIKSKAGWWSGASGSIKDGSGHEVEQERVILYIHGGAFFFSSLDTHRYQVQRHARKAGARAFSPAYRLAPQYPFPCGLLDSLAAYLYLITPPPTASHSPISPTDIIFMGDSAGAGMCISLLILIREMGLPMPAGASLISPWVDLTHSMPSIGGIDTGDFIPNTGFHYRPSATWPPLPGDGITSLSVDGTEEHYDNQVQMYCANNLLSHPLISPVNQGSLGGLCPLLIIGGGGELLRDEIIYLAHKAANPTLYLPSSRTLADYPEQEALISKYKPTQVHLQIYEGCCHVVPTLSWTSSAKYMYRACANFNIWAYNAASKGLEMRFAKKEKAHRHAHRHKRRQQSDVESGAESEAVSRSSTLNTDSAPSRQGSTELPKIGRLKMTATSQDPEDISSSPITPITPASASASGSGTPGFGSTDPSLVDLTTPLISSSAAALANQEGVYEEDVQSECSSSSCSSAEASEGERADDRESTVKPSGIVSVTGTEPLPPTGEHIVSERVSTRGRIRPFEPIHEVPALHPDLREHIGQVHPEGAIKKWMAKRKEWDEKYKKDLDKWWAVKKADRERAEAAGFLTRDLGTSEGVKERPPLSALAGWYDREMAREVGKSVDEVTGKVGMGAMLWMRAGHKAEKDHAGGETVEEIKQTVQQEIDEDNAASAAAQEIGSGQGQDGGQDTAAPAITTRGRRRSSVARPASAGLTGRARADTIRSAQVHVQMAEEKAKGDEV